MFIIAYDFSNDKIRTRFSKFIQKFGGSDSVLIFQICEGDKRKIKRYGYAENEEKEVIIFS